MYMNCAIDPEVHAFQCMHANSSQAKHIIILYYIIIIHVAAA